jgi:hypothetical protein
VTSVDDGQGDQPRVASRLEEYWDWVAVALFLLITVDLLTSLYAKAVVGLAAESNPLMVWLFSRPIWLVVAVHIAAGILAVVFFYALFETIREAPPRVQPLMLRMTELYLGLLVAVGLFLFANNLAVIVLGASLL